MFGEFLNIIVRSLKLDKSLYRESKYFGEAGLYFAGEIMDGDGITGGFNFQHCWTSGWIAGKAIAETT